MLLVVFGELHSLSIPKERQFCWSVAISRE